jgi:hypothetical protein
MYGYGYSLYNQVPFGRGGIDPSAAAYFTATGITGATQQTAIDNLVKGLKADGLWSKMKAVYPFVTDQRNLASFTEDFLNAGWSKTDTTVTANATTAPDSTTTADRLIESATTNTHRIFQSIATSGTNTYSIYIKYNGRRYFGIRFFASDTVYSAQLFDVQNGVIGNKLESGMTSTATMTSVGNGWYRCSISANVSSINMLTFLSTTNTVDNVVGNVYAGDGTSGVFLWGAQAELGTLTTYQPQLGSAQAAISSQFKYNLVNPVDSDAAFRLVFNGGWTHSSNGATPNGTNGYADTKLVPSSVLLQDSVALSFYSRTNTQGNIQMGVNDTTNYLIQQMFSSTKMYSQLNGAGSSFIDAPVTQWQGLFTTTRTSSTNVAAYKNGVNIKNDTKVSTARPTLPIYLGARNDNGAAGNYDIKQTAFSTIGDGLTDTEAANLYTRVQAFQTQLFRQV